MGLSDDLISFWPLDEQSGNALDAHGTNNLTDVNTVGSGVGIAYNSARLFMAASNERFTITSNGSLTVGDADCTLAAWMNMTSKSQTSVIMQKGGNVDGEYFLYYDVITNRFLFDVYASAGYGDLGRATANNIGSPSAGVWYFVVGWHDSVLNTVNIQVNNTAINSTNHSLGIYSSTENFYISSQFSTQDMNGRIGPAMFLKRVLTQTERTKLWNHGNGRNYNYMINGEKTDGKSY